MFRDRTHRPPDEDLQREELPTPRGVGQAVATRREPIRLDHELASAGSMAPSTATCPQCESPMPVNGFCMNCWDVC